LAEQGQSEGVDGDSALADDSDGGSDSSDGADSVPGSDVLVVCNRSSGGIDFYSTTSGEVTTSIMTSTMVQSSDYGTVNLDPYWEPDFCGSPQWKSDYSAAAAFGKINNADYPGTVDWAASNPQFTVAGGVEPATGFDAPTAPKAVSVAFGPDDKAWWLAPHGQPEDVGGTSSYASFDLFDDGTQLAEVSFGDSYAALPLLYVGTTSDEWAVASDAPGVVPMSSTSWVTSSGVSDSPPTWLRDPDGVQSGTLDRLSTLLPKTNYEVVAGAPITGQPSLLGFVAISPEADPVLFTEPTDGGEPSEVVKLSNWEQGNVILSIKLS
jgi:hypothetical protein